MRFIGLTGWLAGWLVGCLVGLLVAVSVGWFLWLAVRFLPRFDAPPLPMNHIDAVEMIHAVCLRRLREISNMEHGVTDDAISHVKSDWKIRGGASGQHLMWIRTQCAQRSLRPLRPTNFGWELLRP